MSDEPSSSRKGPQSKRTDKVILFSVAVGGLLSFLASGFGVFLSVRVIDKASDITGNPALDPDTKAALLKDAIDTAIGWNRFGLLAWPIGSLIVSVIALGWVVVRWRR